MSTCFFDNLPDSILDSFWTVLCRKSICVKSHGPLCLPPIWSSWDYTASLIPLINPEILEVPLQIQIMDQFSFNSFAFGSLQDICWSSIPNFKKNLISSVEVSWLQDLNNEIRFHLSCRQCSNIDQISWPMKILSTWWLFYQVTYWISDTCVTNQAFSGESMNSFLWEILYIIPKIFTNHNITHKIEKKTHSFTGV